MPDLKFNPVAHDHKKFLARAQKRDGFAEAYEALELEYSSQTKCWMHGRGQVSHKRLLPSAWALQGV